MGVASGLPARHAYPAAPGQPLSPRPTPVYVVRSRATAPSFARSLMKPCPFCAEQIQDAAVLCRFCGRELGPLPRRQQEEPGAGLSRLLRGAELALGFGAVALVTYLLLGTLELIPRTTRSPATEQAAPQPDPPRILSVAPSHTLWLSAGEHFQTTFQVDDPRPCTLTGQVRGLAGGGREVDVLLLDEDSYHQWRNHEYPPVYFQTRSPLVELDVPVPKPGRYVLVISNRFSVLTGKRVEVSDARVTCR